METVLAAVSCLPGKLARFCGGDGVDAVEGGDVVVAQDAGVGNAIAAGGAADAAEGLHDRPAVSAAGEFSGEGEWGSPERNRG